MNDAINQRK
ncbi:hypothetical protein Zm00014a_039513 [Zea mays]|uniref:Uncharacterized protein n=1 Tax=Zea mays TaxID=4577 RepID=A0A3L6DY94_MAIZE|nr:hypothetical protein Zm00014a_039513 [Zea mays]